MKHILLIALACVSNTVFALEALQDSDLQQVEGQAGADLSLKLSLNHRPLTDDQLKMTDVELLANLNPAPTSSTQLNLFDCNNNALKFCRLAVSFNKRFVTGTSTEVSDPTQANPANRLWVVFKGIQGTLNYQLIGLDGVKLNEVLGGGKYTVDTNKAAIQFGAKASMPVQIRQFGFDALAIEKDGFTSYIEPTTGRVVEPNNVTTHGYLAGTNYEAADGSVFDIGREKGFLGMEMHGNLALQGKILMYSCSPTATSRC